MTQIKIDGEAVEVRDRTCAYRACLWVGRYVHRSAAGASGCSARTASKLSCLTRDNHGCPGGEREKVELARVHGDGCSGARYPIKVKTSRGSRVRCLGCGALIPRWAIINIEQEQTK